MTLSTIKKKLHEYIDNGDPDKIKLIYSIVENEDKEFEWSDEFVKELDRRKYEMDNDLVKTYSLDEMITAARKKTKARLTNGTKNTSKSKQ